MKSSNKSIQIRVRCWLEVDGVRFFGPGRADLLERIRDYGSIAKAASSMGMSCKKAWASVDEMNTLARKPFVITSKGGRQGGGATVTAAGKKAISNFRRLNDKIFFNGSVGTRAAHDLTSIQKPVVDRLQLLKN